MTDSKGAAMTEDRREFPYRLPGWILAIGSLAPAYPVLRGFGMVWGMEWFPGDLSNLSFAARQFYAWWYFILGAILAALEVVWWCAYRKHPKKILFTRSAIIAPRFPFPRSTVNSIPYSSITSVRYSRMGHLRTLRIAHPHGRFAVDAFLLRKNSDFDEILVLLRERLAPYQVTVESREFGWRRPQFSLAGMLLAMTLVAALLGLRFYADPSPPTWHDLVALSFAAILSAIWIWLVLFASWSTRLCAIGFVLGCAIEVASSCLLAPVAPGATVPPIWYPLSLTWLYVLVSILGLPWDRAMLPALGAGVLSSGIAGAVVAFLSRHTACRIMRAVTKRARRAD